MTTPPELRYHREHLWARDEDGRVRTGVTDYAQDQLGEIVYVDLPEVGARVEQGQAFGEIESTKTVSDLHAPLTGTVVEQNDSLQAEPGLVNRDPYGAGWMLVIEPDERSQLDSLLTAGQYDELTAT